MKAALPYSYIVIEGNIGAGKTSLANIIANKFNTELVLEQFAENTFLPQFYEHPERFAFPLEMSFLAERFQQIIQQQNEALNKGRVLIGDYLFEKSLLFASVNLSGAELDLFNKFYTLIKPAVKKPELILYLHKTTGALLKNIDKRGRNYEKDIPATYLEKVGEAYHRYFETIENQRVLIIESDHIDFVNNSADLRYILNLLQEDIPESVRKIRPDQGLK